MYRAQAYRRILRVATKAPEWRTFADVEGLMSSFAGRGEPLFGDLDLDPSSAHALAAAPVGDLQPVWKARDDLAARQRHHHGACFGAIASRSDTHVTATQQICMQKHTRRGEGATVSMSKPAAPAIHPSRHSSLAIQRRHLISSIHMLR